MSEDRKQKKLDLLKNAVENGRGAKPKKEGKPQGGADSRIMYRGRPVGGAGGGGGAPGAPGSGSRRPAPERSGSSDDGGGDIQEAMRKLNQLFTNGLINKSEYEAKKAEILNRL